MHFMGRNKNELIRKLSKVGKTSYSITLPINIIRQFKWRERQKLIIEVDEAGKSIVIRDLK